MNKSLTKTNTKKTSSKITETQKIPVQKVSEKTHTQIDHRSFNRDLNSIHNRTLASIQQSIIKPNNFTVKSTVGVFPQSNNNKNQASTRNFNDNPMKLTRKQYKTRLAQYQVEEENNYSQILDGVQRSNSALLSSLELRDSKYSSQINQLHDRMQNFDINEDNINNNPEADNKEESDEEESIDQEMIDRQRQNSKLEELLMTEKGQQGSQSPIKLPKQSKINSSNLIDKIREDQVERVETFGIEHNHYSDHKTSDPKLEQIFSSNLHYTQIAVPTHVIEQLENIKMNAASQLQLVEEDVSIRVQAHSPSKLNQYAANKVAAIKNRQGTCEWRLWESIKPRKEVIVEKKQPIRFSKTKVEFEEILPDTTIRVNKYDGTQTQKNFMQRSFKELNRKNNMAEKLDKQVDNQNLIRRNQYEDNIQKFKHEHDMLVNDDWGQVKDQERVYKINFLEKMCM